MTAYEINGKEYAVEYDLDNCPRSAHALRNRISSSGNAGGELSMQTEAVVIKVEVNNDDVEHKHQAGQIEIVPLTPSGEEGSPPSLHYRPRPGRYRFIIQNDIMAHPSRLNSVIARAKDGSKFKLEWYHKNYPAFSGLAELANKTATEGSPATAGTGDILEHYRYTAFGEVTIYNENGQLQNTTQIDNHILWNTRRRDEVTGYYMYKFRHYSAELGRWPSRDPIEESGGVNLYAFVGNEPIGRWDRLGNAQISAIDAILKGVWATLPPGQRPQDPIVSHAQGLKSIKDALAMLERACGASCPYREYAEVCLVNDELEFIGMANVDSNPGGCDKQKCKTEAKKAVDAMAAAWSRNYGLGPAKEPSHAVGGYYCWDWSNIFIDALESQNLKCLKFKENQAQSYSAKLDPTILGHVYVRVWGCKENVDVIHTVVFDSGYTGRGCGLFGLFPQGTGMEEIKPPYPAQGHPDAEFIPAPR